MFSYQKLVDNECYDVDKDSMSIIEKFSVFYIDNDHLPIFNFLKKKIIQKYNLKFFNFLIFNIKSIEIFDISRKGISNHFRINEYINFSKLEEEIFNIINPYFIYSNSSFYDIKFFIRKYFWNHIVTERFEFIQNPHRWEYIDNSIIFLKNILINELKMSKQEMDNFITFIQCSYDFKKFSIKDFNLHFEDNLTTMNLDFGYVDLI
jgi:hypothetical protein